MLRPLLRGGAASPGREAYDQAVYRDQLRELDRDIERGLLTETEAGQARLEIQRRLLGATPDPVPVAGTGRKPFLALLLGIGMAGGAMGLWLAIGTAVTPSVPGLDPRAAAAIAQLAERVRTNPDDAEAWSLYARAMTRMERWSDAETAWRRAIATGRASPADLAALGEILVLRERGAVAPEARGLFEMALEGDPKSDIARYYLGQAKAAAGDAAGAVALWRGLLEDLPPDSPGRRDVARRIAETARAAGLATPPFDASPGDRTAMIEGMVGKLAARLQQNPDDAEGWTRLGQSYAVLGRGEAAADAYEKAAALKPDDPALKRSAAEALLAGLKPEDKMPSRALALLRQVEAARPDDPAALWYLGLEAARARQWQQARDRWTRLAAGLPADSEDGRMVKAALDALEGKP